MSDPHSAHAVKAKKSIFKRPIFLGCLGFTLFILLALAGGAYWLMSTGKKVVTDEIRKEIVAEIQSSELPEDQKAGLTAEIDRITDGFQSGDISLKQLIMVTEKLSQSPAMRLVELDKAEGDPIAKSGMTELEKEMADLIIRRFVYGVFEERIPDTALNDLLNPLLDSSSNKDDFDSLVFRSDISDTELRAAIQKAKVYADEAGIAEANISPDFTAEVREIINRVLEK